MLTIPTIPTPPAQSPSPAGTLTSKSRRECPRRSAIVSSPRANPVQTLLGCGQSVWLDNLHRSLFTSGEFRRLISEGDFRGATMIESMSEEATSSSTDYLEALHDLEGLPDAEPRALYEGVAIRDIRAAAALLRPLYDATSQADGYVSFGMSPNLAHDTAATIIEARRLWKALGRENVMVRVPASVEGVPAIRQLTREGINVDVTLLFGVERYQEVARAYIEGASSFIHDGGDPARIRSVATFFVSRIDVEVDKRITARLAEDADAATRACLWMLLGTVAIANAKLAYQRYREVCRSEEWKALAALGAHPQRLSWASTSNENPRYRDLRYVEELIGPETVSVITPTMLEAFRDHGRPRPTLETNVADARQVVDALERAGISLREVTDRLLEDGVQRLCVDFDRLLARIEKTRCRGLASRGH